jgi:hypothetical protein
MDREQLLTALRNAHTAEDTASAQRLARMLYELDNPPVSTAGDLGRAAVGGLAAGVSGILSVPSMIGGSLDRLTEKVGLVPEGWAAQRREDDPLSAQNIRGYTETLTGGLSEYEPQTTGGKYLRTGAEFLPGIFGGGGGLLSRFGLNVAAPAVASESAGQLTQAVMPDSPTAEAIARFGGAMLAPSAVQRAISPGGGTRQTLLDQAETLREADIPVTAGQETRAGRLVRGLEDSMEPSEDQLQALTTSVMRGIGSSADEVTSVTLNEARTRIGSVFDDVTANLRLDPTVTPIVSNLDDIYQRYAQSVEGAPAPFVLNAKQIFDDALSGGRQIDADTVMRMRSGMSRIMATSKNPNMARAASEVLEEIDEVINQSLMATGRVDDVARLQEARRQYRDYLAIERAATAAGAEMAGGLLTPNALRVGVQGQSPSAYVRGQRGDLGDITRAAQSVLKSLPSVLSGGGRALEQGGRAAMGVAGTYMGGPLVGIAGLVAPEIAGALARTRPAQAYLRNQLTSPQSILNTAQRALIAAPSAVNQTNLGGPR